MAKRDIVWTKTASKQRRLILSFWNKKNQSITYSLKLITQVNARLQVLSDYPQSGKKANFPNTRVAALEHFSIFYQFDKTQIIITSFWDNRQNPTNLFKLLSDSPNWSSVSLRPPKI